MSGLVKIGMIRESIDNRMKGLYSTGVSIPFHCAFVCEVNANRHDIYDEIYSMK